MMECQKCNFYKGDVLKKKKIYIYMSIFFLQKNKHLTNLVKVITTLENMNSDFFKQQGLQHLKKV